MLEPQADGTTKGTYRIEIALGPLVPKAIITALVDTQLPKLLENFKSEFKPPAGSYHAAPAVEHGRFRVPPIIGLDL